MLLAGYFASATVQLLGILPRVELLFNGIGLTMLAFFVGTHKGRR